MNTYAFSAGVLGASGYAGRELCALLARHQHARVVAATARSAVGAGLRLPGYPTLALQAIEDARLDDCDVVFSCLPHGESATWLERAPSTALRVDLSSDLRPGVSGCEGSPACAGLAESASGAGSQSRAGSASDAESPSRAAYGLTELARERVRSARLIANPGCYPTAALLALAPLLMRGLVAGPVVINAASGVTGAGRSPKPELLFGEVAEDYRAYGLGNEHRHLGEMRAGAAALAGAPVDLIFAPHLLPVRRGILETIHVPLSEPLDSAEARALWLEDYAGEPFIDVCTEGAPAPSLRDVVGTNRVAIGVWRAAHVSAPALQVVVAIDNLVKGAAGQAVQNMNLALGLDETEGLTWPAA